MTSLPAARHPEKNKNKLHEGSRHSPNPTTGIPGYWATLLTYLPVYQGLTASLPQPSPEAKDL